MIGVSICGACGKMGRRIIKSVSQKEDMNLVAAIDKPGTPKAGADAGELSGVGKLGVKIEEADRIDEILKRTEPDVQVDFTVASAAVENVKAAARNDIPVVVGTTGFSEEQRNELEKSIKDAKIPAVIASNMSLGVNVFFKLVEEASKKLKNYDMELIETHHNQKKDSPSGTALTVGKIAAEASGKDFDEVVRFGRPRGELGERPKDEIGIHSVRAGDIAGDHNFILAGPSERIELIHRAQSRQAFIGGVIKAIRHVTSEGKPGKIENMQDVLFGTQA